MQSNERKDTFLKGAALLGAAGMLVKVLGAFFRIPLGNIIGSDGMGYYQVGYSIYNFLLAFTAAGFPTAISTLVAAKRGLGDYRGAHRVFRVAFRMLFVLGGLGALFVMFFSGFLSERVFSNPKAYYAILAMGPAIFFVSILAAFRGYFQGMKDMAPTAASQVVEQLGRVVFGLAGALVLVFVLVREVQYAAAFASFGASIGAFFGALTLWRIYKGRKAKIVKGFAEGVRLEKEPVTVIMKDLVRVALPIAIGTSIVPLMNMFDAFLVVRRLQMVGFTYMEANSLYGQLQGMANTLVNLPQVLTIAIAVSVVPVISEAFTLENHHKVRRDTKSALRVGLLIGLPASVGLGVLAGPIMSLLFPNEPESIGMILLTLAPAVIFLSQIQVLTGVLQGLGRPDIPVRNLMVGALVKFGVTYVLTGIEVLNVRGAAIGTVLAYIIAFSLNFRAVKRYTRGKISFREIAARPVISALGMGIIVLISYQILGFIIGGRLSTVVAILIGGVSYGVLLMLTQAVKKEDFELIPKGEKLHRLMKRLHLMR